MHRFVSAKGSFILWTLPVTSFHICLICKYKTTGFLHMEEVTLATQKYHYIINFQKNRRILTYCKYFLQLVNPGRNTSSNLLPSQLSLLKGKQSCCIDIHMYMTTRNIACFPQKKQYIFYFCIISPGPDGNKPQ